MFVALPNFQNGAIPTRSFNMRNPFVTRAAAALAMACTAGAHAGAIADFESGLPTGWTAAGNAWAVVAEATGSVHIGPAQGASFAASGAPGTASESATGTLTSGPLTASFDTLQWQATGWSGPGGNGANRFELLNASQIVVGTVAAPLNDNWSTRSFNLAAAGFHAGDTFYFRAVDSDANTGGVGYAWLAVDDVRFSGAPLPVPEPGAAALFAAGLTVLGVLARGRAVAGYR
ncbi:MAG: hypothetical protein EOP35_10225 [Rubrivivax sp.]|nr:MAG: hypothetical protein EOP35_10225 [Rubrivivax sp.]